MIGTCCFSFQHDCYCLSCHNNCFSVFLTTSLNKSEQIAKPATKKQFQIFTSFGNLPAVLLKLMCKRVDLLWQRSPQESYRTYSLSALLLPLSMFFKPAICYKAASSVVKLLVDKKKCVFRKKTPTNQTLFCAVRGILLVQRQQTVCGVPGHLRS